VVPGKGHAVDTHIEFRRIYDRPARSDGVRVLVDRVWPRGVRKEAAQLDEWLRQVAPSTELRRWYGHDPEKFDEFRRRYLAELKESPGRQAAQHLRSIARQHDLTLLTATRDVEHSQAAVLAQLLSAGSARPT
jgi:uncharacterized protein YeaO (DUF488 family)